MIPRLPSALPTRPLFAYSGGPPPSLQLPGRPTVATLMLRSSTNDALPGGAPKKVGHVVAGHGWGGGAMRVSHLLPEGAPKKVGVW